LSRTQLRQRPMLAVYAVLLILIAAAIGGASLTWLTSRSDDRLAVISNFLSFGTLLLALVAGVVALAAYSAATGRPNLRVALIFPDAANEARFVIPNEGDPPSGDIIVGVGVKNTSAYAARTPTVLITFYDAAIKKDMYVQEDDWAATAEKGDIWVLQWDGGPNYTIHGDSFRIIENINLKGLFAYSDAQPKIGIRLLADGYSRPEIKLPIEFTTGPIPPRDKSPMEWL
jgi:hypothetical protein